MSDITSPADDADESLPHGALFRALYDMAFDKAGHEPGFDFLMFFAPWPRLPRAVELGLTSPFLTTEERSRRFNDFYTAGGSAEIIRFFLDQAAESDDELGRELADRIIARMRKPARGGHPKPLVYYTWVDGGLAVAIVITDVFWSKEW